MKKAKARRLLKTYLESRHTVLWQEWDISKPDGMEAALDATMNTLLAAGIVKEDDDVSVPGA